MDKIISIELALVIFVILCHCSSSSIFLDDDDDDAPWNRCPYIRNKLKNGRVKIRNRGRIAKFACDPGYDLAGKRFATCVRGQWNNPVPVCVARGCFKSPEVPNGRVTEMYRGAVLMYDCLPGYALEGPSTLYCDGRHWSSVAPTCVVAATEIHTSCDFEDPNLCSWTQDPTHDFDWKRNQFSTPSGHAGTGPSYDHTFGVGKGGYYLYGEASAPRKPNDVSRLFSPVYSPDLSGGCFLFWYHMYGSTIGGLRVYVKPESHVFGELSPAWELYGDQGDHWLRGNVSIPKFNENFQIIIEGIRGTNYIGDTAIDDVYLSNLNCEEASNTTESVPALASNSCRGRCREISNSSHCDCTDSCHSNGNCCYDFDFICTGNPDSDNENPQEEQDHLTTVTTSIVTGSSNENLTVPVTDSNSSFSTLTSKVINITTSSETVASSPTSVTVPSVNVSSVPIVIVTSTSGNEISSKPPNTPTLLPISTSSLSTVTQSTSKTITPVITETTSTTTSAPSSTITQPTTSTTTISTSTTTMSASTTTMSTSTTTMSTSTTTKLPSSTTTSPVSSTPSTTTTTNSQMPAVSPVTSSSTLKLANVTSVAPVSNSEATKSSSLSTRSSSVSTVTPQTNFFSTGLSHPINFSQTSFTSPSNSTSTFSSLLTEKPSTAVISTSSPSPATSAPTTSTRRTYNLRPRSTTTTRTYNLRPRTTSTTTTTSTRRTVSFYTITERPTRSWNAFFITRTTKLPQVITTTTSPSTKPKPVTFSTSAESITIEISVKSGDAHASKSAMNERQPTAAVVSIIIVGVICAIGGGVYFMRRRAVKRQSKLSDDSEMRFLSENEFAEYSDPTTLDKMLVN